MALSTVTVTFDLAQILGTDYDPRRTKVRVYTNVANQTLIDTAANKIRMGDETVTLASDGTGSFTTWAPGPDGNPTTWQTYVAVAYPQAGLNLRKMRVFGPYTITANADLADLEEEQAIPPAYLTTVTTLLDGYVSSAAASAALAEAITGLTGEDDAVALLLDATSGSATRDAAVAGFVPQRTADYDVPDGVLIGNRVSAAGGSARLLLEVVHDVPDPDETILQHYSGYSFYHGVQTGTGSLQGGSDQATAWVGAGASLAGTVLGYEGIAEGNGDDASGSLPGGVIGLQGTALMGGVVDAPLAVSVRASGPRPSSAYTGTLTEARSLDVQEPTIGATKRAIYAVGASRLRKGAAANALEIANASDLLQWASDGAKLTGYASDGASERVVLDPRDAATSRASATWFNGSTKGFVTEDVGGTGTGNHFEAKRGGSTVFAVKSDGTLDLTLAATATAPTNGSAGATPASPWFYAKAVVNGNNVRIPCYYDF